MHLVCYSNLQASSLEEIGREVVDKLSSKKASYYVKRFVYIKYAVRNNPLSGVRQTPAEDSILKDF